MVTGSDTMRYETMGHDAIRVDKIRHDMLQGETDGRPRCEQVVVEDSVTLPQQHRVIPEGCPLPDADIQGLGERSLQ